MVTPKTLASQNMRSLLLMMGVGEFNATLLIPSMFLSPSTTDPASSSIILLISHLQQTMNVPVTGKVDAATSAGFQSVLGPTWAKVSWGEVAQHVVAKQAGFRASSPTRGRGHADPRGAQYDFAVPGAGLNGLGALPSIPLLPEIPGGTLTYLALAGAGWWYFKKHRKGR